jgi:hypothetical protein
MIHRCTGSRLLLSYTLSDVKENKFVIFFSVTPQLTSGQRRLTGYVPRSNTNRQTHTHTYTRTHTKYDFSMIDQLVARAAIYTTKMRQKRMPSAEFKPVFPANQQPQTYVSHRKITWIARHINTLLC